MREQVILSADRNYGDLRGYLEKIQAKKMLLVCGDSITRLNTGRHLKAITGSMGIPCVRFSDFCPNPAYGSVIKGVEMFEGEGCDVILAVGGGSAMDVAKCIRLYSGRGLVPLVAVPTTAGSGSEATQFAVIYRDGEKQSIADGRCIPDAVLIDPKNLRSLPTYQKKASMMDAFCHAVESFWSVRATEESKEYAGQALRLIMGHFRGYLDNGETGNRDMLMAAHLAGKAINIAQTTAGHAMCYKLTSLYGIAHGHAAALCVSGVWPYMLAHMDSCADSRGRAYLAGTFKEIAQAMGCKGHMDACHRFQNILESLQLEVPKVDEADIALLKTSVNPVRLKNTPVWLDEAAIERLYRQILEVRH